MSETVQITLSREDWAAIVRLTERSATAATESADDAEDFDPDEGPDYESLVANRERERAARELAERVRQQVEEGSGDGRSDV